MKRSLFAILLPGLLVAGCGDPRPRSRQSFDEIVARVAGMNAAEIATVLGPPDSRQPVYLRDERWIWWNYTFLAGEDYPPEVRGQVVHLEITFRNPSGAGSDSQPYSQWHIAQPFGVSYRRPGATSASLEPAPAGLGGT